MDYDLYQTEILEVAQSAANYRRWLARLTFPYLGANPLEFGSGIGDYAKEWLLLGCDQLTVSENSPTRFRVLQDQFFNIPNIKVQEIDIENFADMDAGYSSVVSLNVVEHLKNDGAALRGAHNALTAGGYFIAFTPAFPILMSEFDVAVGHHRRYTKRTARELLTNNGFEIVEIRYVNSIGWFAWLFGMRLLKITPRDSLLLKAWDKLVIPIVSKFESLIAPPFGQSILIVGRKV
jgi:SAM-dependent methyltransferase